ncbi:MAG: GMC oxidoreductase, partial [Bauldia litoralis]
YIDDSGEELFQPADLVLMCSYSLWNVHLLLHSGLGEPYDPRSRTGVVGRNYAYQTITGLNVFYDREMNFNPFMGAGALGMCIDEFNGDNFDHADVDFIGGGYIAQWQTHGRPIEYQPTPDGAPKWGAGWKKAMRESYNHTIGVGTHGAVMSYRGNYLDLDPTYNDAYGRPLLRMTFDYKPNEIAMSKFLTDRAVEIARAMGGREIKRKDAKAPYDIAPYQTTHNTGGTIMGATPADSVVNRYLQSWDLPNLFVQGASVFPQNPGYNPTGTVGALAYHSARAIRETYRRNPGPMVDA